MALPNNVLQQVQTYQSGGLAFLDNLAPLIGISNKKFKDFENLEANLGDTVTFDLQPRYTTTDSLIANFQDSQQRVQSLTVDQAANTSYAFNVQQFIFNVRDYMEKFGKAAVREIGTKVELNVGLNAKTNTYRTYGDGNTAINSFGQLAKMLALYRNYGAANGDVKVILPDTAEPDIVNSGLNQFVMNRNNEAANSWEVGDWMGVKFYRSNLLPQHLAGTVGTAGQTLTVISTNDPTGANITQITFSGASTTDSNAIKKNDVITFDNFNFLTFIGHAPSSNPVQVRATADAASDGSGHVVVSISPALVAVQNQNQNIGSNVTAGLTASVANSHRCGLVIGGDALFLAMPRLPEEVPFPTANESDPETGVAMRMYYGSLFGQNQRGMVHDIIWGSTLVPEYAMRLAFPLNQ